MIAAALLQTLNRTLRDWRWSHSGWAIFVGAATLFANGMPLGNGIDNRAHVALAYNVLQFGFPLVLLLGLAHRLVDQRLMAPALAYSLVVLIEVVCGVWLFGPLLEPWLGAEPWWTEWNNVVLASWRKPCGVSSANSPRTSSTSSAKTMSRCLTGSRSSWLGSMPPSA